MRALGRTGLLASFALAAWAPAVAQTTTGSIRGYVRTANGAPISDVQVVARNVAMGVERGVVTTPSGFYNIPGLRPGQYQLTARRIGLAPQTRPVQVLIGQTHTVDFQLAEAAVQLQAVVTQAAGAGATETRTSEVGGNVTREQIENLPLFDRNVLDLAKLVPGVTPSAVNEENKFISAGGRPAEAINIFVDGATYKNDVLRGGVVGQDASKGNPFPQGAVQEFRVITQNFKAEYQKASSAIITATTRSGGNQWEGDAFVYGINKGFVARDPIGLRDRPFEKPNYTRYQAGGSLGGPLARDKLFFFGTYELNTRDEPKYVSLGGLGSQAPAGLNLQQYLGRFTSEFRQHLGFGKLTWVPTDRSTVDASFNLRKEHDFRGFGGQTSFQSAENVDIDVYTGVTNWRYSVGNWLNEAQVNLQRMVWTPEPLNRSVVGRDYQGLLRIGGRDTRQEFTQDRLSLRNDVTRSAVQLAGDHVFKLGGNVDFLGYEVSKELAGNPIYKFRSNENWARPFEASIGFGNPRMTASNTQFGAYVQDDWTVTSRLVLNLGIRWDAETNMNNNSWVTPANLRDSLTRVLASQFVVDQPVLRPDGTCCDTRQRRILDELGGVNSFLTTGRRDRPIFLGAWQPRLGASFDLFGTGRTVLFGGGGVYYDRTYWNVLLDEQYRRQYAVIWDQPFNDVGPTATCPRCLRWEDRFYDPAQLRPLLSTATEVFLVKNELKPPKSFQYTVGVRQEIGRSLVSVSYNGVRGYNGVNFVRVTPWGGLQPAYLTAFATDDRVRTWYDALQLLVERQMRGNMRWGGSLAYTLARAEEQGQSQDLFWPFDDRYPTVPELPRRRAPNNQTHTIVANAMVRLPYELRFSTLLSFGSGMTANATDASRGWEFGRQRQYVYTPPAKPFLGIGRVFNTQTVDLRLEKDLPVASGQHVAAVLDLFNAFNSANFGCYEATIFPTSGPPNANYGRPGCAGPGRRLQLGLRYGLRPLGRAEGSR